MVLVGGILNLRDSGATFLPRDFRQGKRIKQRLCLKAVNPPGRARSPSEPTNRRLKSRRFLAMGCVCPRDFRNLPLTRIE